MGVEKGSNKAKIAQEVVLVLHRLGYTAIRFLGRGRQLDMPQAWLGHLKDFRKGAKEADMLCPPAQKAVELEERR